MNERFYGQLEVMCENHFCGPVEQVFKWFSRM